MQDTKQHFKQGGQMKPTLRAEMKQKVFEELGWIWASERGEDSMAIQKEIEGFIAQVEAKARDEERRRLDKLRQMMWELMPKSSDYGGQELTQSHKEQVKGFQECISIIDYELKTLTQKEDV